jgi:hypothetical protein
MMLFNFDAALGQTPPPCPTAPPPITIPYSSSYCVHLPIGYSGCSGWICYCERTIGIYHDIAMTSVTPDPSTACDAMSWRDIILNAEQSLMQSVSHGEHIGPCDGTVHDTLSMNMGSCWNLLTYDPLHPPPSFTIQLCLGNTGWCQIYYSLCSDLGAIEVTEVGSSYIPGDCGISPPGSNGLYQSGTCYQMFFGCPY